VSIRLRRAVGLAAIVGSLVVALAPAPALADAPTPASVVVQVSGAFASGQQVTLTPEFTPAFPDGYQMPATTVCSWELLWGDTASLANHVYDETFGSLLLRGKAPDGFCGPWTFTVPYSASGRWEYRFTYGDTAGGVEIPYTFMNGTNGAPAGSGVTESTLPGVWLSMPHGTRQGDTVTATAHPFGGYAIPTGGTHWDVYSGCNCQPAFASATNHQLSFTFTAKVAGTIVVFYNDSGSPETGGPNFAGAGIDPKVVAVRVTSAVPSTIHRYVWYPVSATGSGFVGTVTYRWYVDGVRIFTGRTGHLRFTHLGWHTIKVVATDGHGHRATRTVSRYVRP